MPDTLLKNVTYSKGRLAVGDGFLRKGNPPSGQVERLFCTKFEHWRYEEEVRVIVRLEEASKEAGYYFRRFDKDLELKEVVAGARCTVGKAQLRSSLGSLSTAVTITKARLAFRSFSVVTDQRGFRGPRESPNSS